MQINGYDKKWMKYFALANLLFAAINCIDFLFFGHHVYSVFAALGFTLIAFARYKNDFNSSGDVGYKNRSGAYLILVGALLVAASYAQKWWGVVLR